MKAIVTDIGNTEQRLVWNCPGCRCSHGVPIAPEARAWKWNGDTEAPTLDQSVVVDYPGPEGERIVCHSVVRAGEISFLGDCTHDLAGKTVPMEDME